MKITHGNQAINLFPVEEVPEKVTISLSGGADSASLLYLVAKHFPQVEVIPVTCRDLNAPKDADAAVQIVAWIKNHFPNSNIHDTQIFDFNDRTEDFVSFADVDKTIKKYPQFTGMRRRQVSKIIQVDRINWNLMKQHPGAVRLDGMTRNPPTKEMKSNNFYDKAERRRDQELPEVQEFRTYQQDKWLNIYQAYINVDKKFVAGVYKENGLIETLFPMTRSCVGTARQTDNFTRECRQCFWCHERKWAFDLEWEEEKELV
jgi:7-cyano-7-deazaguanine synthase in queuosine biosynthesis